MVERLEHENWTLARAAGALGDRTNGKAERFIRTMLGGWACGAIYGSSKKRTAARSGWLDFSS